VSAWAGVPQAHATTDGPQMPATPSRTQAACLPAHTDSLPIVEGVSVGGRRIARTCVAFVAVAGALMSSAGLALGARLATPSEQQSMLAAAIKAEDASSGDPIDYAIANRFRGAEYGLLLAGTGDEYGLTILEETTSGWVPQANGSDMANACSDIGGPIDQKLASACLAFEYVPQGKYAPGVKFMPIHCGRGESVLKVPAIFLKLGYYDPITECFRSHPYKFVACGRFAPDAISHSSCRLANGAFDQWATWAQQLMGDGWRESDVKKYEAVLVVKGQTVTCTPTVGQNVFCWTGRGRNLTVFSEYVALHVE
jgi:hypothetical protein